MELPGFGLVPAHWDLRGRFDDYVGGVEVAGKSVLDVGAATGFLSFEAEKRAASRVVSFDMSDASQQAFLPFKDKLYYRDPDRWAQQYGAEIEQWKNAYWLCHRLLGSKAQVYYGSVYDLPKELGQFDIAIVGSVLEHLSDQISALASIAKRTRRLSSSFHRCCRLMNASPDLNHWQVILTPTSPGGHIRLVFIARCLACLVLGSQR